MTLPIPSGIKVDVTNPGQFFACCGLLELAYRLWPGAQGWFDESQAFFNIQRPTGGPCTFRDILQELTRAGIDGELSDEERHELANLESRKRELRKYKKSLPKDDEERRKLLGRREREGALSIGDRFRLRVGWWQEEGDDVPKTFAGRQGVLRIAAAMLSKVGEATQNDRPLEYRCLLQAVKNEPPGANDEHALRTRNSDSKVEPFYFDAKRFAHALDVGFSLDVQEKTVRASAAPAAELFALIGLQRFRPRQSAKSKWVFEYWTWPQPLCAPVAAAVACGAVAVPGRQGYRFRLKFRDDQKRYKAFGFAIPIGGEV